MEIVIYATVMLGILIAVIFHDRQRSSPMPDPPKFQRMPTLIDCGTCGQRRSLGENFRCGSCGGDSWVLASQSAKHREAVARAKAVIKIAAIILLAIASGAARVTEIQAKGKGSRGTTSGLYHLRGATKFRGVANVQWGAVRLSSGAAVGHIGTSGPQKAASMKSTSLSSLSSSVASVSAAIQRTIAHGVTRPLQYHSPTIKQSSIPKSPLDNLRNIGSQTAQRDYLPRIIRLAAKLQTYNFR